MTVFPRPHPADGLARGVAAALGTAGTDAVAAALAAGVRDPACYEGSVRVRPGRAPRAGRMMIEQASGDMLAAIAHALAVALPPAANRWLEFARHAGMPIITGWDLRSGQDDRCVKLYVNASDASRRARIELSCALVPGVASDREPPAVVGMNARADGVAETKLYVQAADAVALAHSAGPRAMSLAQHARDEGADAGGVLSFDTNGHALRARAFFVALREPNERMAWDCVRTLPGYDASRVESLLPFPPAPPRSVGVSLDDDAWTLYCKPRGSGRAPEALEPTAIFRIDDAEVGVFVEPTEHAARAFRRTARHAVSVRVRDGEPSPHALEALVDWFTARLRVVERDGAAIAAHVADPPAPWRAVEANPPRGDIGNPS